MKRCSCCKAELAKGDFGADRKRADGLNIYCKGCIRRKSQQSYQRTLEASRKRKKRYNQDHKNQLKEYQAEWHQQNKERRNKEIAARRKQVPEKLKAYADTWRQANRDKERAKHKRYRQRHPEAIRQHTARRRARIKGANLGKVSYKRILERDGYICHICGQEVSRKDLNFDHIIPLSKGGSHTASNIAVSHAICNNKKGTRVVISAAPLKLEKGVYW